MNNLNLFFLLNGIYLSNWSLTFSDLGQFFSLIAIFSLILFLTYYTTRFVAKSKLKYMNKGNINFIETFSIGTNHLHIIKIGEEFFLISSSKEGIRLISKLDAKNINLEEKDILITSRDKFKKYFNNNLSKLKNKGEK